MGRGCKHLLAQSKPALLLPSQLATVPCWVCTPSSPEIKCIKQCEDGLCQPRIHCLAFCNSTAVESGYKMPSLLKNSSTFLKGVSGKSKSQCWGPGYPALSQFIQTKLSKLESYNEEGSQSLNVSDYFSCWNSYGLSLCAWKVYVTLGCLWWPSSKIHVKGDTPLSDLAHSFRFPPVCGVPDAGTWMVLEGRHKVDNSPWSHCWCSLWSGTRQPWASQRVFEKHLSGLNTSELPMRDTIGWY